MTFEPIQGATAGTSRVYRPKLGCPGAPPPGCVATVELRPRSSRRGPRVRGARRRLILAPNTTAGVALPRSRAMTRRIARRAELLATTTDPEGRASTTSLRFFLEVPGTPPA